MTRFKLTGVTPNGWDRGQGNMAWCRMTRWHRCSLQVIDTKTARCGCSLWGIETEPAKELAATLAGRQRFARRWWQGGRERKADWKMVAKRVAGCEMGLRSREKGLHTQTRAKVQRVQNKLKTCLWRVFTKMPQN